MLARSDEEEAATRAVLLECAGSFSPRVEECSEDGVFRCVLDIAGTEKLFGPPERLARTLLDRINGLGIAASIAVSCNFHAAVVLAAGLTADRPVYVIAAGEESEALAPLPLARLGLAGEQAETFASWGISTLGMLARCLKKNSSRAWGRTAIAFANWRVAKSRIFFSPSSSPFMLAERMELDAPVELLDSLLFVVDADARSTDPARAGARSGAGRGHHHALARRRRNVREDRSPRAAFERRSSSGSSCCISIWKRIRPRPQSSAWRSQPSRATPAKCSWACFHPQLPEPSRLDVTLARIRAHRRRRQLSAAPCSTIRTRPDGFRMEPFRLAPSGRRADASSAERAPGHAAAASAGANFRQPCITSGRRRLSFAIAATPWNERMVRGLPAASGGIRRSGGGSNGIWWRARRMVPCSAAA